MLRRFVYSQLGFTGMVFTFAYNYLAATLRSIGDTRAALFFLLISLGYNLLCAWLLVGVLGIAIFAVPAGPIGSGLMEAMEEQ